MDYNTKPTHPLPQPGYYYHYKHDPKKGVADYAYFIYGAGSHTEDDCRPQDKFMQVYQPLYDAFVFKNGMMFDLRPLHMFYEPVEWQGNTVARFTRITDSKVIEELRAIKRRMYPAERYD